MKTQNKSEHKDFKKWLGFLIDLKGDAENIELITHYFFIKFSKSPETFYQFIRFFDNRLRASKDPKIKKKLAAKYLAIISTLCERFGFFEEKSALDDFCFKLTKPKAYEKIDRLLEDYKKESKRSIDKIMKILMTLLRQHGYKCEVKGRYKDIYSISKKLQKKSHKDVFKLNDLFAFRIMVNNNSTEDCFEILDLLHDQFYPLVTSFKDYITIPKINGYQSLHTGLAQVIPNLDLPIEIQIRTKAMHDFSELGLASHWLYSKGKKSKLMSDKERKLMDHLAQLAQAGEDENMVYFLSSYGDVFKLEKGARIIDFAYRIHTNVGERVKSAIVNGKTKDIHYKIQECDKIKILVGTKKRADRDWLDYTTIKSTRKKIYESIRL